MREIADESCMYESSDRLTVKATDDADEIRFSIGGAYVCLRPLTARGLALSILAETGGDAGDVKPVAGGGRKEALESAIAHVSAMTTNDRGYGTVTQDQRAGMVLKFAAFLLGE